MKHSPVGASSGYRWFECPGSVALIATLPPQPSSKYAREGSAAHKLGEICLTNENEFTEDWLGEVIEIDGEEIKVTQGMINAVDVYIGAIKDDLSTYGLNKRDLIIERSFELPRISKKAAGTNDAFLYVPFQKLIVYDYKHGAGVWVDVVNNIQLLYYALGAVADLDVDEVELVIVQPRCGDPENAVRRWRIPMAALDEFAKELTEKIKATEDPKAPRRPGKHCKFCTATLVCPEILNKRDMMAQQDFESEKRDLTVEKIGQLLKEVDIVKNFITTLENHAFELAESGKEIPGFKLVKKRSNRTWIDSNEVISLFSERYGDRIYNKSLLSPAKLEKIVGKKSVYSLTEQKDTGNKLVSNTDKGEAVRGSAISDFSPKGEFEL